MKPAGGDSSLSPRWWNPVAQRNFCIDDRRRCQHLEVVRSKSLLRRRGPSLEARIVSVYLPSGSLECESLRLIERDSWFSSTVIRRSSELYTDTVLRVEVKSSALAGLVRVGRGHRNGRTAAVRVIAVGAPGPWNESRSGRRWDDPRAHAALDERL